MSSSISSGSNSVISRLSISPDDWIENPAYIKVEDQEKNNEKDKLENETEILKNAKEKGKFNLKKEEDSQDEDEIDIVDLQKLFKKLHFLEKQNTQLVLDSKLKDEKIKNLKVACDIQMERCHELCSRIKENESNNKQKRIFANPNIDSTLCEEGIPKDCYKKAVKIINDRKDDRFYIGATSDPNRRIEHHINKKHFKTMHILYETPNMVHAMKFEDLILNHHYYTPGCVNARRGTYGLVPGKNIYYIYFMQ